MRPPLVQISPIAYSGSVRVEVATFLAHCSAWQVAHPDIIPWKVCLFPVTGATPASMARNLAVKQALETNVDILIMVDDDMDPACEFFETAIDFLMAQPEPSVIASPYCGKPPDENVMVLEYPKASEEPNPNPVLIPREDAASRTGIGRVPNIGTGLIAYDMRVFGKIKPPYFDYVFSGDHTRVFETEDCYTNNRLHKAGVPIFCDWDHWSGHWKAKKVEKPTMK